ncbi:hypothetical protein SH139x_003091 [Planctomycetaceae bacterium SH139]
MSIFDRPFLSILLCWTLVFGHVPAWLHHASCDADSCCPAVVEETVNPAASASPAIEHSLCCGQHVSPVAKPASAGKTSSAGKSASMEPTPVAFCDEGTKSGQPDDHDPERCVLCQWLASAGGNLSSTAATLVVEQHFEFLVRATDIMLPSVAVSLPSPRGPPQRV